MNLKEISSLYYLISYRLNIYLCRCNLESTISPVSVASITSSLRPLSGLLFPAYPQCRYLSLQQIWRPARWFPPPFQVSFWASPNAWGCCTLPLMSPGKVGSCVLLILGLRLCQLRSFQWRHIRKLLLFHFYPTLPLNWKCKGGRIFCRKVFWKASGQTIQSLAVFQFWIHKLQAWLWGSTLMAWVPFLVLRNQHTFLRWRGWSYRWIGQA